MNIDDFWCRAFLAAMGDHSSDLERCEEIANAAVWRAQRNGMVDKAPQAIAAPTLVRVEFTAAPTDGGLWDIHSDAFRDGFVRVRPNQGTAPFGLGGDVARIKWGETMPPKPIEVWLGRPSAISPAPPGMSDSEVAAEFYRRFGPIQVHMGEWRGRAAVAELDDDGDWASEMLPDGSDPKAHRGGEPGFVAAVERARELVRKGGAG